MGLKLDQTQPITKRNWTWTYIYIYSDQICTRSFLIFDIQKGLNLHISFSNIYWSNWKNMIDKIVHFRWGHLWHHHPEIAVSVLQKYKPKPPSHKLQKMKYILQHFLRNGLLSHPQCCILHYFTPEISKVPSYFTSSKFSFIIGCLEFIQNAFAFLPAVLTQDSLRMMKLELHPRLSPVKVALGVTPL